MNLYEFIVIELESGQINLRDLCLGSCHISYHFLWFLHDLACHWWLPGEVGFCLSNLGLSEFKVPTLRFQALLDE